MVEGSAAKSRGKNDGEMAGRGQVDATERVFGSAIAGSVGVIRLRRIAVNCLPLVQHTIVIPSPLEFGKGPEGEDERRRDIANSRPLYTRRYSIKN